jgi:hypothetical protein
MSVTFLLTYYDVTYKYMAALKCDTDICVPSPYVNTSLTVKPFFFLFSSPGQRPCELLPSLGIRRRPSYVVNFHI